MTKNEIREEIAMNQRIVDSLRADLSESRSEFGCDVWESIDLIIKYQNKVNELENQLANAV